MALGVYHGAFVFPDLIFSKYTREVDRKSNPETRRLQRTL